MSNIIETLYTLATGRRPAGRNPGELFINMAERIIGYTDANRVPVDLPGRPAVGTVAPPDPMPGDLWFDTTAPGALKIYLGATLGWITAGGGAGGAATHIGDAPPAAPVAGQLWFKTIAPIGLFVWLNDGDSTQWVQTQGGGTFVQGGTQTVNGAGQTQLNFDQVPNEANEMDVILSNLVAPAGSSVRFGFAGATGASYASTWQRAGAAYTPPVNGAANEYTMEEGGVGNSAYFGLIRLRRSAPGGGFFGVSGNYRRATTELITTAGRVVLNLAQPGDRHFIQIRSSIAFTAGAAVVHWRT